MWYVIVYSLLLDSEIPNSILFMCIHVYMCVSSLQDSNFMTSLELAVRFGKTLIIQEMDGVEPVLYPLLRKELIAQGTHTHTHTTFFHI